MKTSRDRILTTHVGSLPRPPDLLEKIVAREVGESIDEAEFASRLTAAVRDVVAKQVATGIDRITVHLGDQCAAAQIEAAVNEGKTFAEAFPGEGSGGLAALRRVFLRKGFLGRQERLLRDLRAAGFAVAIVEDASAGIDVPAAGLFQDKAKAEAQQLGIEYVSSERFC